MKMQEKYEWFIAKLKEEGYWYSGHDMLQDCDVYKYGGDEEFLAYPPEDSRVAVWIYKNNSSNIDDNTKITAELNVKEIYYYKTSSLEDIIAEIEKIKKTKDISDLKKEER